MSQKKLKCIALEFNEELHAAFIACMSQYDATEIGFIDEVSKDEQTLGWHYVHSSRGKLAHAHQPFVHGHCVSLEALLSRVL
jgi:predicted DNA-binding protein with PD1-like motif